MSKRLENYFETTLDEVKEDINKLEGILTGGSHMGFQYWHNKCDTASRQVPFLIGRISANLYSFLEKNEDFEDYDRIESLIYEAGAVIDDLPKWPRDGDVNPKNVFNQFQRAALHVVRYLKDDLNRMSQ